MAGYVPYPRTRRGAAIGTLWSAAGLLAALASWSVTQAALASNEPPVRAAAALPTPAALPAEGQPSRREQPALIAGATGTATSPTLPSVAAQPSSHALIVPAPSFSIRGAPTLDRARAVECLAAAIHYEAASEGDAGQRAVAQVVLNRVRHPAFPATICEVVYQGSERRGCQFSFACDGSLLRLPSRAAWARATRHAAAALAGGVYAPVGLATHYHTFAVTPAWNRELVMTNVVGTHFFHRWRGWWGSPPAFRRRYAGGEPPPGPHMPIVALPSVVPAAVAPGPAYPAGIASEPPPESPSASAPTRGDRLPPASQVLDRWRDSGKPLR